MAAAAPRSATIWRSASGISGEGIAIQQDSIATRIRMIGTATWTLRRAGSGAHQADQRLAPRRWTAFNIFDAQYFAADLENEAVQQRLAEALADQITMQLAVYFRQAGGAASGT